LSPAFPMLMAAGGIFWERTFRRARARWVTPVLAGAMSLLMLIGGVIVAPFALAMLPEERFIAYQKVLGIKPESEERRKLGDRPQFHADMHGWDELTDLVARTYGALAAHERAGATIWTRSGGYGPAAAIDYFGRAHGLPPAISGHNNYWYWGPGTGDGKAVIIVGGRSGWISRQFE